MSVGSEATWAANPIWTLHRTEKFLLLPGIEKQCNRDITSACPGQTEENHGKIESEQPVLKLLRQPAL
jgi:hypothetical protein